MNRLYKSLYEALNRADQAMEAAKTDSVILLACRRIRNFYEASTLRKVLEVKKLYIGGLYDSRAMRWAIALSKQICGRVKKLLNRSRYHGSRIDLPLIVTIAFLTDIILYILFSKEINLISLGVKLSTLAVALLCLLREFDWAEAKKESFFYKCIETR